MEHSLKNNCGRLAIETIALLISNVFNVYYEVRIKHNGIFILEYCLLDWVIITVRVANTD